MSLNGSEKVDVLLINYRTHRHHVSSFLSLVCASANQILRLPSFLRWTLTHPAAPGEKGGWVGGVVGVGVSGRLVGRAPPRPVAEDGAGAGAGPGPGAGDSPASDARSAAKARDSFHLPSGDPSGAAADWLEHPPRAAVTQGNGTSGDAFRNKSSARGSHVHAGHGDGDLTGARYTCMSIYSCGIKFLYQYIFKKKKLTVLTASSHQLFKRYYVINNTTARCLK